MTSHEDAIYKILVDELWPGGLSFGTGAAKELSRVVKRLVAFQLVEIRPTLAEFATVVETQLEKNDHKGGWENTAIVWLVDKLFEEVREVDRAVNTTDDQESHEDRIARIVAESGDVAAVAMMIADSAGLGMKREERRRNGRPIEMKPPPAEPIKRRGL